MPEVAGDALKPLCHTHEFLVLVVALNRLAELGHLLDGIIQGVTFLPGCIGMSLARRSAFEKGTLSTRATSRTTALAPSVPKVAI